jgi:hypothetical protein
MERGFLGLDGLLGFSFLNQAWEYALSIVARPNGEPGGRRTLRQQNVAEQ